MEFLVYRTLINYFISYLLWKHSASFYRPFLYLSSLRHYSYQRNLLYLNFYLLQVYFTCGNLSLVLFLRLCQYPKIAMNSRSCRI